MISFHTEDIVFDLPNIKTSTDWLVNSIINEQKEVGNIDYIFCSDQYLHKINLQYLNHDTFTDIVTFNYCENNEVNADIFISIDRVKENAIKYNKSFINELHRVMIHGILHLVGYNDKTKPEQDLMTTKEDFYLSLLF